MFAPAVVTSTPIAAGLATTDGLTAARAIVHASASVVDGGVTSSGNKSIQFQLYDNDGDTVIAQGSCATPMTNGSTDLLLYEASLNVASAQLWSIGDILAPVSESLIHSSRANSSCQLHGAVDLTHSVDLEQADLTCTRS